MKEYSVFGERTAKDGESPEEFRDAEAVRQNDYCIERSFLKLNGDQFVWGWIDWSCVCI